MPRWRSTFQMSHGQRQLPAAANSISVILLRQTSCDSRESPQLKGALVPKCKHTDSFRIVAALHRTLLTLAHIENLAPPTGGGDGAAEIKIRRMVPNSAGTIRAFRGLKWPRVTDVGTWRAVHCSQCLRQISVYSSRLPRG